MTALWKRTATQLAQAIAAGDVSAIDVCNAHLERIATHDTDLNSFLHIATDARDQAQAIDSARANGERLGPLAGVPVAVKDNLCTTDMPTTAGSRILEGYLPPYDASVVTRLRTAGAVLIGKTNLDEFAMGSSTENSAYGPTRNPWDRSRVPGGSSGGSAAAVTAGLSPLSLGSDTGGSIRQPAALCGCVGFKPTYGLVSRYGLLAFASSLDQVGPLARTTQDLALLMDTIAGPDSKDSTCRPTPAPSFSAALTAPLAGFRVGVVDEFTQATQEPAVRAAVDKATNLLRDLGAEIVTVHLPRTAYGISCYYIVAPAEASSNLARYDGVHYGFRAADPEGIVELYSTSRGQGFGSEVKRRVFLGTYVLSSGYYDAYYLKAQRARQLIAQDFASAFESCDFIVGPTSPTTAFALGERTDDPLLMYAADVFTVMVNLAGIPGLSVPCGFDEQDLPIGLQLIGPQESDARLLQLAHHYEQARGALPEPVLPAEREAAVQIAQRSVVEPAP